MPRSRQSTTSPRFPAALTVLVIGVVLYFAREVLIPIALAVLLAFLLAPLVRRLERHRVPRMLAVGVVITVTAMGIGTLAWVVQGEVVQLAANLPQYKGNIATKLNALRPSGDGLFARAESTIAELRDQITKPAEPEAAPEARTAPSAAETGSAVIAASKTEPLRVEVVDAPTPPLTYAKLMLGPFLSRAATTGIVVVFAIFMLMKREDLRNRFLWLVGERALHVTTPALDEAGERVSRYLAIQLVANTVCGAAVGIGLLVLGVPNAALWGFLIVLMRFIPYIGVWLAALLPLVTSIAVSPDWSQPLMVLGLIVVIEVVTNNLIEPMLFGARTGLSPIAILAAAVFWAWLWGPVGLLLATPLTVCLAVIGRHVPSMAFLDALLGDEPVLSPESAFYQRLLAGDQDEATRLMETFGKQKDLAAVYDGLILPAMRLAEADRHRGNLDPELSASVQELLEIIVEDTGAKAAPDQLEPSSERRSVLCLPARDDADELAARMLSNLLVSVGIDAQVVSNELLLSEMVEQVALRSPPVVCISALPPAAALHSRVLCKRLGAKFPAQPVVIGVWDAHADALAISKRLGGSGRETVVTTLAQAVDQIRSLVSALGGKTARPVSVNQGEFPAPRIQPSPA